jgi:hypothetical protein
MFRKAIERRLSAPEWGSSGECVPTDYPDNSVSLMALLIWLWITPLHVDKCDENGNPPYFTLTKKVTAD